LFFKAIGYKRKTPVFSWFYKYIKLCYANHTENVGQAGTLEKVKRDSFEYVSHFFDSNRHAQSYDYIFNRTEQLSKSN
jgi:hypothetical protein